MPTLPVSAVGGLVRLEGDEILFHNESFIDPPAWYRYRPAAAGGRDEVAKTALAVTPAVDMSGVEVAREFAVSKDGTRVPINLITRKGARRAGRNPTVLSAYGGYGISLTPRFDARVAVWLEQGGVYAIANLRGGGEYGEAWHRAGNLTRKQNVFDDFTACARWLIDAKVTSPKKLAILGGSNGGLLMGAALTQHPELYGAVVSYVGIYDMLRVELSPNGAFNVTEFGTVKDPEHFKAMHAYSPYHHVVDKTRYPAVLLTTGENDPRVDPMQSRKMTARLQAATGSRAPVLLVTNTDAGHGAGSRDQRIRQRVYMFAFLMDQLGMTYKAPRSAGTKDRAAT